MKPLKIVIISFSFYPESNPRSFRATELAKELAHREHHVIVYSLFGNRDYEKFTKETGVMVKNLNPNNVNNIILKPLSFIRKIFRYFLEYPLIKLVPMVKKAIQKENEIDYLITIAYPHHIHWGAAFANLTNVKCWVADCGDPYMKNPIYKPVFYSAWFEKKWGRKVDYITIPVEKGIDAYYQEFRNKIRIIPQGFDCSNIRLIAYKENDIPTFTYAGNCYKKGRDVSEFLKHLSTLNENFRFVVYTQTPSFFEKYSELLGDKMIVNSFIPRDSLLTELSKMDFLINIRNESTVQEPSKIIDYCLSKRPVLEISSLFVEKKELDEFLHHNYTHRMKEIDLSKYEISTIADQFLSLYAIKIRSQKDLIDNKI